MLIEQLPAVLWTVDKNLRFTSALGAGLARLGLKPNQLVGMSLSEYFETGRSDFSADCRPPPRDPGEPVTFPLSGRADRTRATWSPCGMPRTGPGRNLHGARRDRPQTTEEQFRQAQKMEAVGRLAGGIAHDFNNLLMVIQGYADLMAERLHAGDPLRRNAEQIQTAAQRAASLTRQLLAFSRKADTGAQGLDVENVVKDMEDILRRLIGEDVDLRSPRSLARAGEGGSQPDRAGGNEPGDNARDAMPKGGRLTIEMATWRSVRRLLTTASRGFTGQIRDAGGGLTTAAAWTRDPRRIFSNRSSRPRKQGKGTGLGLATVYGVVKQSGGYIWVYTEPGLGTTFKIYLPRIDEDGS